MKTINFTNQPDFEVLAAAGIILTCNEDMDFTISDEDYKRMETEFPAAFDDSFIVEETRKLYALQVKVWDADDYLNDRNTDPIRTDLYLFATKEEARNNALALHADDSVYNECFILTGELTTDKILEITGFDTIEDFDEALEEPYSDDPNTKNYGETEKTDVAKAIIEDPESEEDAECANYDFDKSLEGSILVFWSWEKYVGYARKCIDIRRAEKSDTAAMLTKRDKTFATQCDVLLTAEEVAATTDIQDLRETVTQALENSKWKWTNPTFTYSLAKFRF